MKYTLLTLTTFTLLITQITPAQASLLEFFFPSLRNLEHNPEKNLEAPFADKELIQQSKSKNENTDNAIPLDLPHRSPEQIQDWILQHTAEHLTFPSRQTFENDLQKLKPFFTDNAWTQYNKFINETNIRKIVENGRYAVRAFINEPPTFINKGPANDAYRWLYQVPFMISYLESGKGYAPGQKNPPSQHVVLKIQLGRYNNTGNDHGILIDHWNARVVPTKTEN